jgi:hypothetical protein
MPGLSTKADPSFFRKIVKGAVGARAVQEDLSDMGHDLVELENGSAGAKIWKDVKRKRVRIPDLVCKNCGQRVESRAKANRDLKMSHSTSDAERSWDFGLIGEDLIAFPICKIAGEETWTDSDLTGQTSYYHNRDRVLWKQAGLINYFTVYEFRNTDPTDESTKGVTEGSETMLEWGSLMSSRKGVVYDITPNGKIGVERESDGNKYKWASTDYEIRVDEGDEVELYEILASDVSPAKNEQLLCPGDISEEEISEHLNSSERTLRFTGVKIARLRSENGVGERVEEIRQDPHEDLYNKIEAAVYLSRVKDEPVREQFNEFLSDSDPQTRLESIVGLSEVGTDDAVSLLAEILNDSSNEFFLRSASAWALGQIGTDNAAETLVDAFEDISIREEALDALDTIGGEAEAELIEGVKRANDPVAAGSAEILRRQNVTEEQVVNLLEAVRENPEEHRWSLWTVAHLPRDRTEAEIAELQEEEPELHYAVSVIWSFLDSWISDNWDKYPSASDVLTSTQKDSAEASPEAAQLSLLS